MTWPPHPDDEWVEVTSFGDTEPTYITGQSGAAKEIGVAKAKYVAGQTELDDFETAVKHALSHP